MRVPVYNPQARSTGLPGVRQQGSAPPVVQVGALQAQQTQQLGEAASTAGNQLARIQIDMQAQANQLRVDDAINKAREAAQRHTFDPQAGYLNIKGEAALNRQSGKPLVDEYSELLDTDLKGIADSLGNDAQRAAFSRVQQELTGRFREQIMRHEGEEYRTYRASVREGTIANRTNEIALAYNNPQVVTENIDSIKAAVWDLGQLKGWSGEKITAQQRDATSVAHRTALAAALQNNDVMYADAYMKRFAKDMNADDILRVQGLITKDMDAKLGAAAATQAVGEMLPRFMPSDSDRLANIINTEDFARLDAAKVNAESGGRRYAKNYGVRADGTPKGSGFLGELKRPDGGVSTELSIGVEFDGKEREIPALVPTLTKGEIDHLLSGGEPTEAIVDKAVAHAKGRLKAGKSVFAEAELLESPKGAKGEHQVMDATNRDPGFGVRPAQDDSPEERARVGKEYLAAMLKEYGGNVPMALAAYNAGPGNVDKALAKAKEAGDEVNWMRYLPKPQETVPYVQKIMAEFGAGKGAPAPPTLAEVHARVREQVGDANPERLKIALDAAEKQFKLVQADIKTREEKVVADAMRGLQTNGGRYDALPLSVRGAIPPDKVDQLIDYGKKVNQVETNPAVYLRLTDATKLNSLTDDQFYALRAELDSSDWEYFAKQRAGRVSPAEKLNSTAISRVLKNRMTTMGVDTTPKDGSKEAARLGAIRSFVDKTILQEQAVTGKEMSDVEIEKHIDKLMLTTSEVTSWFGLSKSNERILGQDAGDIPGDVRRALKSDFKRMGIDSPTDADLFGAYLQFQYQSRRTAADLQQLNQEAFASGQQ